MTTGRTIVAVFDDGDDFYTALEQACREHGIRQGYIPMFIAGLSNADIVGTCQRLENPAAPVWDKVQLNNVEALGGGTLAYDEATDTVSPHIHITVGLKEHSATGHTSHLLGATVQFLTEMIIVEIAGPTMRRHRNPDLYDVPQLNVGRQLGDGRPSAQPSRRQSPRRLIAAISPERRAFRPGVWDAFRPMSRCGANAMRNPADLTSEQVGGHRCRFGDQPPPGQAGPDVPFATTPVIVATSGGAANAAPTPTRARRRRSGGRRH